MQHLFTVADRYQVEERGCVLMPGVSTDAGAPSVRIGARIRLRTPDGKEVDTFIKDLPEIRFAKMPEKITAPVLLPKDLTKNDVPVGTEVLLLEEEYEAK